MSAMNSMSRSRVYCLLGLVIIIWSLVWPVCKVGLDYITPFWFVAARLIIAIACTFPVVAIMGKLSWPKRKEWPLILIIGIFQIGLFLTMLTAGLVYIGAGRSAILVYSTPIWVTPIAYFFFGEHLSKLKFLGVTLGIIGIFLLFSPWGLDWSNKNVLLGNILMVLSAVSWAISMLSARNMKWHSSPISALPWQLLVALVPVLIMCFMWEPQPHIVWNLPLAAVLFYTGVLATAFAYWAVIVVSKELPVITTSLALLSVPVLSVVASALLLHEPVDFNTVAAMSLILIGLCFGALGNRPTRIKSSPQPKEAAVL